MNIEETFRAIIREELAPILKSNGVRLLEDQLLTAGQAAKLLQVSTRWLYKYSDNLPYAVRLGNNVIRFSQNKIQQEIQRKLKAQQSKHSEIG